MGAAQAAELLGKSLREIEGVFARLGAEEAEKACVAILQARRSAGYGVGREGLMIKALCMRLMHLGLDAHMVGDMTTPPLGQGDLLLVSAGPGWFATVAALLQVARQSGASTLVVTAQPGGKAPAAADVVVPLPAPPLASARQAGAGVLPMGSLYEIAQLIFFDILSILLREKTGQSPEEMRSRHTNLE